MICCILLPSTNMVNSETNKIRKQLDVVKNSFFIKTCGNPLELIKKDYIITAVEFSGKGCFNDKGKQVIDKNIKISYKYKIEYTHKTNNTKHVWCFN